MTGRTAYLMTNLRQTKRTANGCRLPRPLIGAAQASSQPLSSASRTASARVRAPVLPIADDR
jgi:hypothetical protein